MALRRNTARRICPEWITRIGEALGRPASSIETTSLETYDRALETVSARFEHHPLLPGTTEMTMKELSAVVEALSDFAASSDRSQQLLLLRDESELCGAVLTNMDEVIVRLPFLIAIDEEEVVACSADGAIGTRVLWVRDPPDYEPVFVVHTWSEIAPDEAKGTDASATREG